MKKISILLTGLAFSVGFGQMESASNGPAVNTGTTGVNEVLWEQVPDGTSGIVSGSDAAGSAVYSADDFELTMNSRITKITAHGFNNTADLENNLTGVSFYIIADDQFFPAGSNPADDALFKFELEVGDPGLEIVHEAATTIYSFVLDLDVLGTEVILPADRYWLSVVPNTTIADITIGTTRWNWYQSLMGDGSEAYLLDPDDLFGAGATVWTPFSSLGLTWGELAFTIEGEEAIMGVSDITTASLAVYPNPANDVINVSLKNAEVKSISIVNLSGQVVGTSKNSSVNVSALPAGVYVVKVLDNKGVTHTSKVVVK